MYLIISHLKIPIEKDSLDEYLKVASIEMTLGEEEISLKKILSKSLDMSCREAFFYNVSLAINVADDFQNKQNFPLYTEKTGLLRKTPKIKDRPIIVGFGPAGIFAALELIEYGIKPIIFERGKPLEERSCDVQRFIDERVLNFESNIQFGEGGPAHTRMGNCFPE